MRRLTLSILAAAGLALGATAASAADLGRAPVYKAPPAPAPVVYNWSGLYIGGHLGYGWGTDGAFDTVTGASGDVDVDGFLAGAQLGFNWQTGNIVFGIEGDWSWTNADGTVTVPFGAITAERNWYATATARVGYAWDNLLWYVKGGAAWADTDYTATILGVGLGTAGDTRSGWTVGTGLEWMLGQNWSAKLEYNYLDFSDDSFAGINYDSQNHLIKLGLNYRFGYPAAVPARY